MKYIITDKGEVRTGDAFHQVLAQDTVGRVVAAGRYKIIDGSVVAYGESYGYGIKSKPEDAPLVQAALNLHKETLDV